MNLNGWLINKIRLVLIESEKTFLYRTYERRGNIFHREAWQKHSDILYRPEAPFTFPNQMKIWIKTKTVTFTRKMFTSRSPLPWNKEWSSLIFLIVSLTGLNETWLLRKNQMKSRLRLSENDISNKSRQQPKTFSLRIYLYALWTGEHFCNVSESYG